MKSLLIFFISFSTVYSSSQGDYGSIANLGKWFTFGPVVNFNIGKGDIVFSGGVNVAYWNFNGKIPIGLNLGYERSENSENILYSEFQAGELVYGASMGVLYNSHVGFGIQGSAWANFIFGGSIRFRYLDSPFICPGFYISIPAQIEKGHL